MMLADVMLLVMVMVLAVVMMLVLVMMLVVDSYIPYSSTGISSTWHQQLSSTWHTGRPQSATTSQTLSTSNQSPQSWHPCWLRSLTRHQTNPTRHKTTKPWLSARHLSSGCLYARVFLVLPDPDTSPVGLMHVWGNTHTRQDRTRSVIAKTNILNTQVSCARDIKWSDLNHLLIKAVRLSQITPVCGTETEAPSGTIDAPWGTMKTRHGGRGCLYTQPGGMLAGQGRLMP